MLGEKSDVDEKVVNEWNEKLLSLIKEHQTFTTQIKENCFITYNPNKKLFLRNEKFYRGKKSKMKFAVLLTVNVDGTHKLKSLAIGRSENL